VKHGAKVQIEPRPLCKSADKAIWCCRHICTLHLARLHVGTASSSALLGLAFGAVASATTVRN
jgi:hypothetical protein